MLIDTIYSPSQNQRIRVEADDFPKSPREWDNLGVMACWHSRYILGDEQPGEDSLEYMLKLVEEYEQGLLDKIDATIDKRFSYATVESRAEAHRYYKERVKAAFDRHFISLPLYLYDHSGITMSTRPFSCPWDSGQVGLIYISKPEVRKTYGFQRLTTQRIVWIQSLLAAEVEVYDQYLRGDICGFILESRDAFGNWSEDDACWGFFGSDLTKNGILDHLDKPVRDWVVQSLIDQKAAA